MKKTILLFLSVIFLSMLGPSCASDPISTNQKDKSEEPDKPDDPTGEQPG